MLDSQRALNVEQLVLLRKEFVLICQVLQVGVSSSVNCGPAIQSAYDGVKVNHSRSLDFGPYFFWPDIISIFTYEMLHMHDIRGSRFQNIETFQCEVSDHLVVHVLA